MARPKKYKPKDVNVEELINNKLTHGSQKDGMDTFRFMPSATFDSWFLDKQKLDAHDLCVIEALTTGVPIQDALRSANVYCNEDDKRFNLGEDPAKARAYTTAFLKCPVVLTEVRKQYDESPIAKTLLSKEFLTIELYKYFQELKQTKKHLVAMKAFEVLIKLLGFDENKQRDYILQNKSVTIEYILPDNIEDAEIIEEENEPTETDI